jgi:phosphoribosylformylglycinamidine cyclo-ligase
MSQDAYSKAGVNIAAGQQATELMKDAIRKTYTPAVLSDTGAFGGLFALDASKNMGRPVLVASTDGVGTKTMVASKLGRWDTIGQDLVNHCVNDILVQGAEPLFFLDYVASSKLDPEQIASVVRGCAIACEQIGAALLGGETAEMPGVYQEGEIDLVGTIVGIVDHAKLVDGKRIQAGDVILSLPSTGLHTNGYSLARKVLQHNNWLQPHSLLGESIGEALLKVHRCYLNDVRKLWAENIDIKGMAHITGGGVVDNLPRILPDGLGAVINRGTWDMPKIFKLIQSLGEINDTDMYHAFNMGLGFLLVVAPDQADAVQALLPDATQVGTIQSDVKGVEIRG